MADPGALVLGKEQEEGSNVCVAVKIRPMVPTELDDGCRESLFVTPGLPQVRKRALALQTTAQRTLHVLQAASVPWLSTHQAQTMTGAPYPPPQGLPQGAVCFCVRVSLSYRCGAAPANVPSTRLGNAAGSPRHPQRHEP